MPYRPFIAWRRNWYSASLQETCRKFGVGETGCHGYPQPRDSKIAPQQETSGCIAFEVRTLVVYRLKLFSPTREPGPRHAAKMTDPTLPLVIQRIVDGIRGRPIFASLISDFRDLLWHRDTHRVNVTVLFGVDQISLTLSSLFRR